jgi:hypothetical protein
VTVASCEVASLWMYSSAVVVGVGGVLAQGVDDDLPGGEVVTVALADGVHQLSDFLPVGDRHHQDEFRGGAIRPGAGFVAFDALAALGFGFLVFGVAGAGRAGLGLGDAAGDRRQVIERVGGVAGALQAGQRVQQLEERRVVVDAAVGDAVVGEIHPGGGVVVAQHHLAAGGGASEFGERLHGVVPGEHDVFAAVGAPDDQAAVLAVRRQRFGDHVDVAAPRVAGVRGELVERNLCGLLIGDH